MALTGSSVGKVAAPADICVQVSSGDPPRVQEACPHVGDKISGIVEREMFPELPTTITPTQMR